MAIERSDALPGTGGFAGELDGTLVRDVLGRYPCFSEADDHSTWNCDPTALDQPVRLPAGHIRTAAGDETVWTVPDPDHFESSGEAVQTVRDTVIESIDEIDTGGDQVAVAFSGGLDSALLAARLDAPLYVVGFPESHDVTAARSAAALLDQDLTLVELTHEDIERAVPQIVTATGRTNAMDIGIALPLFLGAKRVAADGYDRLALGQGADELFGGYAKVARAPDDPRVTADTIRGAANEMIRTLPGQLERDVLTLRAAGVEPVTPLLHDRVVATALRLPGDMLVTDRGERKWALRLAARAWVPDSIVFREKKAVQYGSLAARELDRLARQAGFKRKQDDHVTKYIESLLDDPTPRIHER